MDLVLELYQVEAQARDMGLVGTAAHRALRQESSAPILARLSTWLAVQTPRHPPKSPMGQALSYATKHGAEEAPGEAHKDLTARQAEHRGAVRLPQDVVRDAASLSARRRGGNPSPVRGRA